MRRSPQKAAAGQLADLADRYLDRIYRFLLSLTGDTEMARDLTQETFLKLGAVSGDPQPAYVFAVARNAAISRLRRRKLEDRHLQSQPGEVIAENPTRANGPDRQLECKELRGALRRALQCISDDLRTTFLLSEIEGLSYAEIGGVLGCPAGTVASRKHNAVRQLRAHLKEAGHAL